MQSLFNLEASFLHRFITISAKYALMLKTQEIPEICLQIPSISAKCQRKLRF